MLKRRAQGMPVNVIIIAALALIVLVVLAAIFTGRVRVFSEGLQSCSGKQGQCKDKCLSNEAAVSGASCPEKSDPVANKICCVPVFNK